MVTLKKWHYVINGIDVILSKYFFLYFLSLSLSFHFFPITCSELTEQKQLNIVIYPSTNTPCLLLGNSIRLTQIIISSHLSLITLFYFHIFFFPPLAAKRAASVLFREEWTLVIITFCSEPSRLARLCV